MDPLGNCMNLPAESAELLFPVVYEGFELRSDSAGAGLHRGGLGAVFKMRFLGDGELSMETSRTREGSPGVRGGKSSAVQRLVHERDGVSKVIGGLGPDGSWTSPLLGAHRFAPGDLFVFESTGGGGWGDPLERRPEEVFEDVLDEYVSVAKARDDYGVVVNTETMELERESTELLRAEMRAARKRSAAAT
jgi:N-methylhydantoinase B